MSDNSRNVRLCDTCGERATQQARDSKEVHGESDLFRSYEPVSEVRYGCIAHPVKSKTVMLNGEVLIDGDKA